MATQGSRVASWYWITSAALTPLLLLTGILWAYFAMQSQDYRAEAIRIEAALKAETRDFEDTLAHMKNLSAQVGFDMGDPAKFVEAVKGQATAPAPITEQNNKPVEDQNAIYVMARRAERDFYGADESTAGTVHQYISARRWLAEFGMAVKRYIAFKSEHYYTVRTIDLGGEQAAVAAGDLRRAVVAEAEYAVPSAEAVDAAWQRSGQGTAQPAEKILHAPTRVTLELILRLQMQLVADLVSANQHQHSLLYGEVAGEVVVDNTRFGVGYVGEEMRLTRFETAMRTLGTTIGDRGRSAVGVVGGAARKAGESTDAVNVRVTNFSDRVSSAGTRLSVLADLFEAERTAHETDAEEFRRLTRNLPRLKAPVKIEKREPDGEIVTSDFNRRVVHINLGRADGVRAGQRFEAWRLSGREADAAVGVIEVVRTLNEHYSLCTVLSLVDEANPIRKGDKIVSRIWHSGRFLTVALHGTFEPPNQAYSKERLTELLRQAGCTVVEKVQPGTDLTITGSNLLGDAWYRQAQRDMRFETIREEDVRIYLDPR